MHPYSSIDATAAWKKLGFILSARSDFHIIDSLLIIWKSDLTDKMKRFLPGCGHIDPPSYRLNSTTTALLEE